MKHRLFILCITVIFVFTLLPTAALAEYTVPNGYNEHDYNAMVNFLNQPSAVAGQTNAQKLGYDPLDPSTWGAITWADPGDGELHLQEINFSDKSLSGSLDLSDCTELEVLKCYQNQLTSLDVSANAALQRLVCSYNQLVALDVSGCTALQVLLCSQNQLTVLDVSGCTALQYLRCSGNQLATLDVRTNTKLQELSCDKSVIVSGFTPPWLYWLGGLGLLVLGAGIMALILIRRRRKKRATRNI